MVKNKSILQDSGSGAIEINKWFIWRVQRFSSITLFNDRLALKVWPLTRKINLKKIKSLKKGILNPMVAWGSGLTITYTNKINKSNTVYFQSSQLDETKLILQIKKLQKSSG